MLQHNHKGILIDCDARLKGVLHLVKLFSTITGPNDILESHNFLEKEHILDMSNAVIDSNAHLSKSSSKPEPSTPMGIYPTFYHRLSDNFYLLNLGHTYRRILFIATLMIIMAGGHLFQSPTAIAQSEPGITSPAAGSSVSGAFPVMGTAVIEPFQRYELYIKQEPNGDDAFVYVSGGTQPITNGQLGVIDSNAFAPGTYSIRLRVVKLDGNYAEYFAPNISFNQGPAPTPTSSEPTPTPIPTATFTPAPQPTPIVGQVTQPEIETDGIPTPTPAPVVAADSNSSGDSAAGSDGETTDTSTSSNESLTGASLPGNEPSVTEEDSSITNQLGEAIGIDRLRGQFYTGMRYSAFAFILVGLLFLAKALIRRFSFRS